MSLQWTGLQYFYFPYSVGVLWEYANSFENIHKNYECKKIFWKKIDIAEIVDQLENPYIFGTSHFVWSNEYSLELCKAVKQKFPDCKIIVGGSDIPDNDEHYFTKYPFIDFCVHKEGEISFKELLEYFLGKKDLHSIKGISYNQAGKKIVTAPAERVLDLTNIPSPYTSGLFDAVMEEARQYGVHMTGVIELDRGCPYHCSFCDWGGVTASKVKKFDMTRIQGEIEWFAQNGIDYVHTTAANFGIFKERDMAIVDFFISMKEKYGFPIIFDTSWAKNNNETTVLIAEKLFNAKMLSRFVSSIQSTNPDALAAIERTNLAPEQQTKIRKIANEKGFYVTTELLMGLPEETYESWQATVFECLEKEMWYEWYPLIVYANSEMNRPEYRKKYGIITEKVITKFSQVVPEYQEIIIGTSKCPPETLISMYIWTYLISALHINGFTTLIAQYLKKKHFISWQKFYDHLLSYCWNHDTQEIYRWIKKWKYMLEVEKKYETFAQAGNSYKEFMQDIGVTNRKKFFDDMKIVCKELVKNDQYIDEVIKLAEIYQCSLDQPEEMTVKFQCNLFDYITKDVDLLPKETTYIVQKPHMSTNDWPAFIHNSRYNGFWRCTINEETS